MNQHRLYHIEHACLCRVNDCKLPLTLIYHTDRYVLIGNHRDAWMFGATDASSGTSVMMEMSRIFHELMKTGMWIQEEGAGSFDFTVWLCTKDWPLIGWRPRRTIIFCSWDGEEYGIIGSIEWLDVWSLAMIMPVSSHFVESIPWYPLFKL